MKKEEKREILSDLGFEPGVEHLSIEAQGQKWAARKRAEGLMGHSDPTSILIIEKEKEEVLDLPDLVEGSKVKRNFLVKYHPITGAIYTFRWQRAKTKETESGKREVVDKEDFEVFSSPREVDLSSIPKSWSVTRLVPQQVWDGLETAMRQQEYKKHDYSGKGGVEQERLENMYASIYELTEIFVNELEEDSSVKSPLEIVAKKTQQILQDEGLINARDQVWKKIMQSTEKAAEKDTLGRINPGRSRFLLRSAYLNIVRREVFTRLIEAKAEDVSLILLSERSFTRTALENSKEMMVKLLREGLFVPDNHLKDAQITYIRSLIKRVVEVDLREIKVSPYLIPARLVEVMLLSNSFRNKYEIENLRKILEVGGVAGELDKLSVEDYIMRRDPDKAEKRLRQAISVVSAVLNDPDNNETRVFE